MKKRKWFSHGLIILELQLARNVFIVLPSFGGTLNGVVGHGHLPPRTGCPVNLHLHIADALANSCGLALERKDASVVIVVDGDSGNGSIAQGGLWWDVGGEADSAVAGGDGVRLQDGDLSPVDNTWITEAHVKVLVLFKDVIINDANCKLFCCLARLEDQSALGKLIV